MTDFKVGDRVGVQSVFDRSKRLPAVWKIVEIDCELATLTIIGLDGYKVSVDRLVVIDVVEQLGGLA